MDRNVGLLDRWVRVLLGLVILPLAFEGPETGWAYLGLLPLLTGVVGWCPLYVRLHIDTTRHDRERTPRWRG